MNKVIKIPYDQLGPEILQGLIEEFVTREGTEYGHTQVPLEQKIEQVKSQLKLGKAVITYDEDTRSCNIVPKDKLS
ncbi:YheU family protein [Desulfobacterales bacterium HSG2]|nr:YheU family protein [Desulfobacterales bacterium HSG2]